MIYALKTIRERTVDDAVILTPEQEDEIEAALAEVRAGLWVDGDELLRDLRESRKR